MSNTSFGKVSALKDYLAAGNAVTQLEAVVLFGVPGITKEISTLRKQGWIIKSKRVPYARALNRARAYSVIEPPKDLPIRDIYLTEYWVSE